MDKGKRLRDMSTGDCEKFTKTITEADVVNYAGITGDFNPVHVNQEFARKTMFKGRIAHGMLSVGLISTVLGTRLPGPGAIYVAQEVKFKAPVMINDTITAQVTVIEKNEEKNRVKVETRCVNQDGKTVIDGYAILMPPKE